jgi:hypothetical protein
VTLKKSDAELVLEFANAPRKRGLGDSELPSSGSQASSLSDSGKISKLVQLHGVEF